MYLHKGYPKLLIPTQRSAFPYRRCISCLDSPSFIAEAINEHAFMSGQLVTMVWQSKSPCDAALGSILPQSDHVAAYK